MLSRAPIGVRALMPREQLLTSALLALAVSTALCAGAQQPEVDVGPVIDIHIGVRNQSEPSVAADTVNNRFLVVWNHWAEHSEEVDVHGQLVNADGALHGATIPISTVAGSEQSIPSATRKVVAFDPRNERFLVVWEDDRNDAWNVYGQLVNADGTLHGANFAVSPVPPVAHEAAFPAVAFDSINGRFLVVWAGTTDTSPVNVYGRLVNPDGSLHGSPVPITSFSTAYRAFHPDLAFDPSNGRFLVTWGERDGRRISGRLVNADGTLHSSVFPIGAFDLGVFFGWLTFDPVHSRFLQIWNGRRGRLIDSGGSLVGDEIAISGPFAGFTSVVFWAAVNKFLLVGDVQGFYIGVHGLLLHPDGSPCGSSFPVFEVDFYDPFRDAYVESYPAVVAAGAGHTGALVAWDDVLHSSLFGFDVFGKLLTVDALTTVHVDDSNTTGAEDGSPQWPFNTIQEGINVAADCGVVKVAQGVYREDLTIAGKTVTILGGYLGGFYPGTGNFKDGRRNPDPETNRTMIVGAEGGRRVAAEDGLARGSVLTGFTIRGGGALVRGVVLKRVVVDHD